VEEEKCQAEKERQEEEEMWDLEELK
jgi:colicin import membrane protein